MLYVMRHGRTDWNDARKLQGRSDIPLNESGKAMARAAAAEYSDVHFDICYSSPLIRAKETAEILLCGRDIPIITDDRLMEMSFGIYEGADYNFKEESDCPINVIFTNPAEYNFKIEGAESWSDLFGRTREFLEEIVYPQLSEGRDILIVGHGAMNTSIICQVNNIPLKDFWTVGIENCKLKKLL